LLAQTMYAATYLESRMRRAIDSFRAEAAAFHVVGSENADVFFDRVLREKRHRAEQQEQSDFLHHR